MKILQYNFAQPDNYDADAGGVGVYMRSIVSDMVASGHDIICMSSGLTYSPYSAEIDLHFDKSDTGYRKVDVVNSPVVAPAYRNFFSLDTYLHSKAADCVPSKLRALFGAIQVFHFHNIEGLPISFFYQLRREFPQSPILLSAHNYNLVCAQVNLWKQDSKNCLDFEEGRACASCISYIDAEYAKKAQAFHWQHADAIKKKGIFRRKTVVPSLEFWRRFGPEQRQILSPDLHRSYVEFRKANAAMCAELFDRVLAVSDRTKKVLISYGMPPDKLAVSRIGSKHVALGRSARPHPRLGDDLRLGYIGYARRDKGFFFLLDALRELPIELSRRISVKVVAKVYEHDDTIARVAGLLKRFRDVELINGYKAEDLFDIMKDIDLGVVPPLWEDNLPQVAIEFAAYGVPFVCSDLGGANEIGCNQDFVFAAGSVTSFALVIRRIVEGRVKLEDFWRDCSKLQESKDHVADLLGMYEAICKRREDVKIESSEP